MLLAGAVVVGLLEETLFRGFYYGGLRRILGSWPAALISSVWFAVLHFAKPFIREGVIVAKWNDGLLLIAECFPTVHGTDRYVPFLLTLFVMGLVLCRAYERDGSLFRAAGLHAGWVLGMRWGMYLWDRVVGPTPGWFGPSDLISKSWATFFLAVAWLIAGELRSKTAR
jgi:membrane protease YdiL (CAAX protease family)